MAKQGPRQTAVADLTNQLSRLKLAAAALALIPHLQIQSDEERVGILLPPGCAGTMVNLAVALSGRTAVNLNHTVGEVGLVRMCELASLRTVITAEKYTERIGWYASLPVRRIDLETIRPKMSRFSILRAMARVLIQPARKLSQGRPDDVAALVFSSGSTGDPKGVQLTHRQLLANIHGVRGHLRLEPKRDVVLSPLPLFHSFGISTGMWMPLIIGLPAICHPDPRDARALGELSERHGPTLFVSTPTFTRGYLRRIPKHQFSSLRFGVVGAEKCPPDLRRAFREKYDAELLEGYGCTELAPVVAVNVLDEDRRGTTEPGSKAGTVGRALPGIEVLAMDAETHEVLPRGETGLLIVRSPARMLGYLDRLDLTESSFVHGGYNTGDLGFVDQAGFITITGRLARFAKIGGEMVPMDLIEEKLRERLLELSDEGDEHDIAITAISDQSKGERLLLLHTDMPHSVAELLEGLDDLPPIFRPKERDAHRVDEIPTIGTGKRDLKGLKALGEKLVGAGSRAV